MRIVNAIVLTLVIVGGINWGLIGFFDFNLVDTIFGIGSFLSRLVYIVVGICGLIIHRNIIVKRFVQIRNGIELIWVICFESEIIWDYFKNFGNNFVIN